MLGYDDIIGQEKLIEYFMTCIENKKVSHAYIVSGETYSGKKTLAKVFAMALQCEEGGSRPCMECHSCKQVMTDNQPDIIWVNHAKPNTIGVDDIRDGVNRDIITKPYSSRYKIYIIPDAEKMTEQAQNALLKTIEEPPQYGIIMLLTNNADSLLQTITSRCVKLAIDPIKDSVLKDFLMNRENVPADIARISVAFAQGNLGKAVNAAKSEDFMEIKNEALRVVKNIRHMDYFELIDIVKQVMDYKSTIDDFFDIMMVWYRDVLMFKATSDANQIIFRDELPTIIEQAGLSTYNGIENIIDAISKAKVRIKAGVKFDLTIELLYFTIKEN